VTACDDGAAWIWSVATGRQMGPPLRHHESVLAATFSPDGKLVATGSRDHTARFWDVATGRAVGPALEHLSWVEDVASARQATGHGQYAWKRPALVRRDGRATGSGAPSRQLAYGSRI
jgi:WD40 repeat protein